MSAEQPTQDLIDLQDPTPSAPETSSEPATETPENGSTLASIKDTVVNSKSTTFSYLPSTKHHHPNITSLATSSAMASAAEAPATQQVKDTVVNGEIPHATQSSSPYLTTTGAVGQSVQKEAAKTSAEFSDLKDARVTPEKPAATGQPLTQYHSMVYRLLSWKNPRATAIVFAVCVSLIFATRYLNVLRYFFKGAYSVLGLVAAGEIAGKAVLGSGMATQFRPKKYYTIRKESLERFLDDVEQMINFVVIEFQRILYVENIWVTVAAFASSFLSYWLIKWLPLWGLTLLSTCITFLAPLVYNQNKEFIDAHLNRAGTLINEQTNQMKDLVGQHTSKTAETMRSYATEYTSKAQEMIGNATGRTNGASAKTPSFPSAPQHEPAKASEPAAPAPEPVAA